MEDLELISLLNECNKMSVLEVSNYLFRKNGLFVTYKK